VVTSGYFKFMDKLNTLNDGHTPFKHFETQGPLGLDSNSVRKVPVKEAKAKLTELLRAVEAGEHIILTRHGKPVADLVPHGSEPREKPMSVLDCVAAWHKDNPSKAIGWVSPDFDDQLPEDFLLQPFAEDFDEKLAAANKRARESRGR
jgi:prevent-host-death family protein